MTSRTADEASLVLRSSCPLDCPDACSLEVEVKDGRVVAMDGSHANPVTDGFICGKVRRFADHLYCPERLMHPGIRDGNKGVGKFRRASWDEALDLITARLEQVTNERGAEAILPFFYGGSNGYLSQDTVDARFFRRLGASRLERTVCAAPSGRAATGLYGKMPGVALQDYAHAKLIVLWGVNPSASGIHLVPYIRHAREAGATLIVVDPRRTPLARVADLHLPLRPGTDVAVALSLIRWLFESGRADLGFLEQHATGVPELRERAEPWTFWATAQVAGLEVAALERFAQLYADSTPAVIRCGWGLERNRNGGSAIASVLALPAVAGKFGIRGGGYTMSNGGAWNFDLTGAAGEKPIPTRSVNMNLLGRALLEYREPPVDALFVYNCNPLATMPQQELVRKGLQRTDLFTVVFDQVMTDTARYADVILPATTFLERREMARGYGALVLHESAAVIEPVGEARSNHEVFGDLCRRMGLQKPGDLETAEELSAAVLASTNRPAELRAALDRDGVAFPDGGPAPIQFIDTWPRTPERKVHLMPPELDAEAPWGLYALQPDPATDQYPLALISPATSRTISSTFGQLHRKQVLLQMHRQDAEARGIADGDEVRVWNEFGEVLCQAERTDEVRPGVVFLPKGLWSQNTRNGATSNALCPDTLTDLGGGACFNDARVQVAKV